MSSRSNKQSTAWVVALTGIGSMLSEDAAFAMPPIPTWYAGRDAVGAFLRRGPLAGRTRWRLVPGRANGQLAFGSYIWDAGAGRLVPHAIQVLTLDGARIGAVVAFQIPEALERFGPSATPPAET